MTETAATAEKSSRVARRRPSEASRWHMSRQAVNLSLTEIQAMTEADCHEYFVKLHFGSRETVRCAHCGTVSRHYWRALENRWKCKCCGKSFSVTSGTVFANRKKSFKFHLTAALLWANSAAGQPALELKRHLDTTYNAAYVLQHKLREGLLRGYNQGLLAGDIEMDGAHQSGWRSAEKRGRPQVTRPADPLATESPYDDALLTHGSRAKARHRAKRKEGETAEGGKDPDFGRKLPKDRRIVFAVRVRSGKPGRGASCTRVAVGLSETAEVAEAVLAQFVAIPESILNTDTASAYQSIGKRFKAHHTVEHSKMLVGPNGENNNQAESFNFRMDRAEKGVHLNIEPKYLLDYSVEMAFREDTRRLPNGRQMELALSVALRVGRSLFWRGYTRGHHRTVELTHPLPRPAPASGPPKGRNPFRSQALRPPR